MACDAHMAKYAGREAPWDIQSFPIRGREQNERTGAEAAIPFWKRPDPFAGWACSTPVRHFAATGASLQNAEGVRHLLTSALKSYLTPAVIKSSFSVMRDGP